MDDENIEIKSLNRFPLSISKREYNDIKDKVIKLSELNEEDKNLILNIICNAIFWKNKYKHLTERIQFLYADEMLNNKVD